MNLFRPKEIGKRFGVPYHTIQNWAKAEGTWRRKLYEHLEKMYARELAQKADM
jgi:transposase